MTGPAPISSNAGAESGDRVSANTSCWFALRRRTSGRPIAPVAPAIRILIALSFQLALPVGPTSSISAAIMSDRDLTERWLALPPLGAICA
jgi:hypothetical protein